MGFQALRALAFSDEDTGDEDDDAADDDLDGGFAQWRFHIAMADPGDHEELDDDDRDGYRHGYVEGGDQKGEGVTCSADEGHGPAHATAEDGVAATTELAIIGQGFGEGHADARTYGCSHTDDKSRVAVSCRERGGEERGKGGHGTIHKPGESRLDHLQDKGAFWVGGGQGCRSFGILGDAGTAGRASGGIHSVHFREDT